MFYLSLGVNRTCVGVVSISPLRYLLDFLIMIPRMHLSVAFKWLEIFNGGIFVFKGSFLYKPVCPFCLWSTVLSLEIHSGSMIFHLQVKNIR